MCIDSFFIRPSPLLNAISLKLEFDHLRVSRLPPQAENLKSNRLVAV